MNEEIKLLVVDDEHITVEIISDIFSKEGFEVITALNCDRALQHLKEVSFNAILTDIRMPERSGIDLLENIRTFDPDIPVIIMTGYGSFETAIDALKLGAFDYLTKPLDYDKLISVVRHAVERYGLLRENRHLLTELQEINATLEQKVRERNREFENILHSTHESIITTDMELNINNANPRTKYIFDRDCVGLKISDLFDGINFESVVPRILSDKNYTTKHEIKFGDKFLEVALSPLIDFETEKVFGLTVVTEDITDRKKLEAQLIQSAKMSAVGQFATGLAHEFNNILSGIIGYTSFAMSRNEIEKIQEDLKVVEKAAVRASEIVTTFLSFSRQKEDKQQLSSLEETIEDAIKLIEHTFKSHGIQIVRYYEKIPPFRMNVGEIQQVVINLALNSRNAMKEGGVIAINTELVGNYVKVDFSDNGIGISKKHIQKIFQPFFSTTNQNINSKSGTGLGLSVVYSIIERHGGKIEVSSEVDQGTIFTIWLPVNKSDVKKDIIDLMEEEKKIEPLKTVRKASVLVVDDEEFVSDLISEALMNFGHNVNTAKSGECAIELIKKNHYDIIFLDLTIHGNNILEFFREIKFLDQSSVTIIISGTPGEDILNSLIAEGAFSFIQKPFKISEIQKVVARILGADWEI
ncbi:response regulator [Desulfobacterota bacterium AH_259_B03_O07]|nr:response regulator [Desulfobacterota bacterium AH_259_B03_O07]